MIFVVGFDTTAMSKTLFFPIIRKEIIVVGFIFFHLVLGSYLCCSKFILFSDRSLLQVTETCTHRQHSHNFVTIRTVVQMEDYYIS